MSERPTLSQVYDRSPMNSAQLYSIYITGLEKNETGNKIILDKFLCGVYCISTTEDITGENTMRAAGYSRVSTTEQVNGSSLDSQKKQIEAYCTMKGIELVTIFVDEGVSGSKPIAGRPEGSKLNTMIESGEIQAVIIMKLDRGFRNVVDCLQSVDAWEAKGIALHIVDMGGASVDSTSAIGRFMLTVLSAAAEMERGVINDRCRAGKAACKAKGQVIGQVPFGWMIGDDGKTLVPNPQETRVITICHELRRRGLTIRQIMAELIAQGIKGRGEKWNTNQVHKILKLAA